jgi:hypothetical protein
MERSMNPKIQPNANVEAKNCPARTVPDWHWMDTVEAAKRGKFSQSYIEKLRLRGSGPPYVKISRNVRYRSDAFDHWMSNHTTATR